MNRLLPGARCATDRAMSALIASGSSSLFCPYQNTLIQLRWSGSDVSFEAMAVDVAPSMPSLTTVRCGASTCRFSAKDGVSESPQATTFGDMPAGVADGAALLLLVLD